MNGITLPTNPKRGPGRPRKEPVKRWPGVSLTVCILTQVQWEASSCRLKHRSRQPIGDGDDWETVYSLCAHCEKGVAMGVNERLCVGVRCPTMRPDEPTIQKCLLDFQADVSFPRSKSFVEKILGLLCLSMAQEWPCEGCAKRESAAFAASHGAGALWGQLHPVVRKLVISTEGERKAICGILYKLADYLLEKEIIDELPDPKLLESLKNEIRQGSHRSLTRALAQQMPTSDNNAHWQSPLPFQGQLFAGTNPATPPERHDLCMYLNPMYKGMTLAFDHVQYPVGNRKFTADNEGWNALNRDLIDAAREAGHELMPGSGGANSKTTKSFVCKHGKKNDWHSRQAKKRQAEDYVAPAIPTGTLADGEKCCTFRFNLGVNAHCFYLQCGWGHGTHQKHAKLAPLQLVQEGPQQDSDTEDEAEQDTEEAGNYM